MSASIILTGNLAQDPELKFTANNKALAKIAVVTSKRKPNAEGVWEDVDTTFWNVTVWDKTAEHVADSLQKGDPVIVYGTAAERSWQNDQGEKRSRIEVNATNIAVDLRRWSVQQNRIVRTEAGQQSTPANDPWAAPLSEPAPVATTQEDFPF